MSDNTATKMLIDHVGKHRINRTMKSLGLKNTIIGNSDLLKAEGLNFSTPGDMAALLTRIYHGRVVSRSASRQMLEIMGRQHVRWGIPSFQCVRSLGQESCPRALKYWKMVTS